MKADELEAGAWVTPTVRLLRPLAEGGMGKVWVAEHLVLETNVVVKLMTKQVEGLAEGAARFAREGAIAAAVKSPHVAQVFDSGVNDRGIAYIVMELLEGHDLGAHLAMHRRMAPAQVGVVIAQLAKALARAHRVGIVHRDIKPENVFLCDVEGSEIFVKLLDFGTAKDELRAAYRTSTGQLIGTPFYMSPEQILGGEVDARSDVWSLGVLAFEALTGTKPFDGATVGAITLAIHTAHPRMTDVAPELPQLLDDWFAHACALSPEERFQTPTAAATALERAIWGDAAVLAFSETGGDPAPAVPAAPVVPVETAPPPPRVRTLSSTLSTPRRPHRAMTFIAAAVGLAAVGAMGAVVTHQEPPTPPPPPRSTPPPSPRPPPPSPSPSPPPPPSLSPPATTAAPAETKPPVPRAKPKPVARRPADAPKHESGADDVPLADGGDPTPQPVEAERPVQGVQGEGDAGVETVEPDAEPPAPSGPGLFDDRGPSYPALPAEDPFPSPSGDP